MSNVSHVFQVPRFEAAEETIEAIYGGEVDALVVLKRPSHPEVVLIQGADEPYRILIEHMSDGALTCDSNGTILNVNSRVLQLTGFNGDFLIGRDLGSVFVGDQPDLRAKSPQEGTLLRNTEPPLPVSVRSVRIDHTSIFIVLLTDIAIFRHAEALAAAESFTRSILEQSTDGVIVLSADGVVTHVSAVAKRLAASGPVGRRFSEVFQLASHNSSDAMPRGFAATDIQAFLGAASFRRLEVTLTTSASVFLLAIASLQDGRKQAIGSILTLTDITERKKAEEEQAIVAAEQAHRVKNVLTIVQALVSQTLRNCNTIDAAAHAISGRLCALSNAHDALIKSRLTEIELAELLTAILAPYIINNERITVAGPPVLLPVKAVLPLSLAFHELATNAVKYGAWATEAGRVEVKWECASGDSVELTWSEFGGPPTDPEAQSGFGWVLIQRMLTGSPGAECKFDTASGGLRCLIKFYL